MTSSSKARTTTTSSPSRLNSGSSSDIPQHIILPMLAASELRGREMSSWQDQLEGGMRGAVCRYGGTCQFIFFSYWRFNCMEELIK
ncbi:hypothetical protein GUJ93_ZPchr0001g31470 [Zizania palustris]|uniref:Uncharacterized protein n=1 Tax=Zizania palustris TaxID=103762 RepID=A0A8J5RV23_ZIZPA|nr:hypothetical protein GUJ93_ZPchr0001g31470 [Zizania palustris]